jgi:hypothetical protein
MRKYGCQIEGDEMISYAIETLKFRWMIRAAGLSLLACVVTPGLMAASSVPVTKYGAACNSDAVNGGGSDDTKAFTAAATAAHSAYVSGQGAQAVTLPAGKSCRIDGTVTAGSGVIFEGPGTIVVPHQNRETLKFENADDAGVENLTLVILAGPGGNHAENSVIKWTDTTNDTGQHHNFAVRKNTITDGSWGILVSSDSGSGSLKDVDISNNTVSSRTAYTNADGIHVNGNVHNITIDGNHISNRHDAAIGLSSGPGKQRMLSGAVVSNNICNEDLVGLDDSGASDAIWKNNTVRATTSVSANSNPAARSMTYLGLTPTNVKFIGNYLENYQGDKTDFTAKVDNHGSNLTTNVEWVSNTIAGTRAMWLAGNTISVTGNTFSPNATIFIGYDSQNQYPGENINIGKNLWKGAGTISASGNPGLYKNLSLASQQSAGTINVVGKGNFHR